jgi:hypothetical protein
MLRLGEKLARFSSRFSRYRALSRLRSELVTPLRGPLVPFSPARLLAQRLQSAVDLGRDRADRRPLRLELFLPLEQKRTARYRTPMKTSFSCT